MSEQAGGGTGRQRKIEVVERFIDGLRRKDMSGVPFALAVVLRSPLTHPQVTAVGESEFRRFLEGLFPKVPPVKEAAIHWHLVEGDHVVTRWRWVLGPPETVTTILDHFVVEGDQIKLVEPFFDPRPLLGIIAAAP
jgi:hypothetical protein